MSRARSSQLARWCISKNEPSGLSRATIYRLIQSGKFPRPLFIGTGSVRWRQSDVIAW
ncbi:MAG: AlpA family phage regulatory protein [Candidatus Nitrotoga sp.]